MMTFKTIKAYRSEGIFLYFTAGEDIDKDYVKTPWAQEKGDKQEPYSTKGSFWIPGKLVNTVGHACDIILHSRWAYDMTTGAMKMLFDTKPKMLEGGSGVYWVSGDRYGRLEPTVPADFQKILSQLYGEAGARAIYTGVPTVATEVSA